VTFVSEASVRLEGPPEADAVVMLQRATQIVESRISALEDNVDPPVFVNLSFKHIFGEINAVEVGIAVQRSVENTEQYANLRSRSIGKPIELPPLQVAGANVDESLYLAKRSRVPALYGYDVDGEERKPAILFLLHCYLQTPCNNRHNIAQFEPKDDEESPGDSQNRYDTQVTGSVVSQLPPGYDAKYSADHRQSMYTHASISSTYVNDRLRTQMPIARRVPSTGSSQSTDTGQPASTGTGQNLDTCKVFDLGLGTCRRIITFEIERVGALPKIPKPLDEYTDEGLIGTLLRHTIEQQPPTLSADGRKPIFVIRGRYEYAMNRPPTDTEKLRVGVLPFTNFAQGDTAFDPQQAYSEEIGP
jgi:hypothetical protein